MKLLIILIVSLASLNVTATDFDKEITQLCDKLKTCTLAEIGASNISPEMELMMKPMIDNICKQMIEQFNSTDIEGIQKEDAISCIKSMSALSFNDLKGDAAETQACADLEKKYNQ